MPTKPIMRATSGLNNVTDTKRLRDSDGVIELSEAVNVVVTDDGSIERRDGFTQVATGVFRDLHVNNELFFAAQDDALVSFESDFTINHVTDVSDSPLYYANVADRTFISSSDIKKIFHNDTLTDWVVGTNPGPDVGRVFSGPPAGGTIIFYFRGVMYVVGDNILWHSEPYAPLLFDYAKGFVPFKSNIVGLAAYGNTLYVSDEHGIYAHIGAGPHDWVQKKVHDSPMLHGTAMEVQDVPELGDGILFTSGTGICFATNDGQLHDWTRHKVALDDATAGCAYSDNTHYHCITR